VVAKLANQTQRRHRPVCHSWLETVQCIIALGANPWAKVHQNKRRPAAHPALYHPAKFHRPASTHGGDPLQKIADKERKKERKKEGEKERNSRRYIPSMPIGKWG